MSINVVNRRIINTPALLSGGSTLAIDGTVHGNTGGAQDVVVNLTTTQSGDYIIVAVVSNGGPVLSVSSPALGAFTFVARVDNGIATQTEEVWAAFSPGALSSETITVHQTSSNFCTVDAFGVSGSGQSSLIFDAGSPEVAGSGPMDLTTVSPVTMAIAAFRMASTANPTAGSGFTLISGADFGAVEYQILLSPNPLLRCDLTIGFNDYSGEVALAIPQA